MCVYVCLFVCLREKNANKKRRFRKKLYFVEFKDICFLKLILELITRSFVNIKKKKKIYFVDKIQKFKFTFAFCYKL